MRLSFLPASALLLLALMAALFGFGFFDGH
jgi:hypothetical protein